MRVKDLRKKMIQQHGPDGGRKHPSLRRYPLYVPCPIKLQRNIARQAAVQVRAKRPDWRVLKAMMIDVFKLHARIYEYGWKHRLFRSVS